MYLLKITIAVNQGTYPRPSIMMLLRISKQNLKDDNYKSKLRAESTREISAQFLVSICLFVSHAVPTVNLKLTKPRCVLTNVNVCFLLGTVCATCGEHEPVNRCFDKNLGQGSPSKDLKNRKCVTLTLGCLGS